MKLLKCHFWSSLACILLVGFSIGFGEIINKTPKETINTLFTFAAFVPYFGYIYRKRLLSKEVWRLFVLTYFLWEIFCFFSYGNNSSDNIFILISALPKYFAIAMYSLYMGSFNLPKKTSLQDIETLIYSKLKFTFIIIVSISIIINVSIVIVSIFAIINHEVL